MSFILIKLLGIIYISDKMVILIIVGVELHLKNNLKSQITFLFLTSSREPDVGGGAGREFEAPVLEE